MKQPDLMCKIADTAAEFEQIHRLNYQTFVEEIPQHPKNPEGRLVDKFHDENTYLIITSGGRLVAMLAMREKRPFSLDAKVRHLDTHLPRCQHPVEIRLLAIQPEYRGTAVFRMLMSRMQELGRSCGWDLVVISATTRQLKLYRHLGFEPFGPLVGSADALYQPMFMRPGRGHSALAALRSRSGVKSENKLSLLPGPLPVSARVRSAMGTLPVSHRSIDFSDLLGATCRELCLLANAVHCQIFPGSGTLANDMVALQLARLGTAGLVLVNGEFGRRIAAQAARTQMRFTVLEIPWGTAFDTAAVVRAVEALPLGGWVWWVHHETSTGILNPLAEIIDAAERAGVVTAVDVVSSLGNVPVDIGGADFVTASSGKGLCGYPGLGIVFHREGKIAPLENVPSYLDLGLRSQGDGVAFTHSSNLVAALATALGEQDYAARFALIARRCDWLRCELEGGPFAVLCGQSGAHCPAVVTLIPQDGQSAWQIGLALESEGVELSYRSDYLRERNWLQIGLMGVPSANDLRRVIQLLMACERDLITSRYGV